MEKKNEKKNNALSVKENKQLTANRFSQILEDNPAYKAEISRCLSENAEGINSVTKLYLDIKEACPKIEEGSIKSLILAKLMTLLDMEQDTDAETSSSLETSNGDENAYAAIADDEKKMAYIMETDWRKFTDGSSRMIFWTTGPYEHLARDLTSALYCMASDGTDTKLCREGTMFLNQTVNNCLKRLGSDIRIEVKPESDEMTKAVSKWLN